GINGNDYIVNIRLRTPPAQLVDGAMARDHGAPGSETASIRVEGLRLPPELQKDLLQDVFSLRGIAQHTQRDGIHHLRVTVMQRSESVLIAAADAGDQHGIRHLGMVFGARRRAHFLSLRTRQCRRSDCVSEEVKADSNAPTDESLSGYFRE